MSISKTRTNQSARRHARTEKNGMTSPPTTLVPAELAVRRIAENEGVARGFEPRNYRLKISESRATYSVLFIPKSRMRGGGLRVGINKRDLKIKQVVHLQ